MDHMGKSSRRSEALCYSFQRVKWCMREEMQTQMHIGLQRVPHIVRLAGMCGSLIRRKASVTPILLNNERRVC